jgi:hypothetical protein
VTEQIQTTKNKARKKEIPFMDVFFTCSYYYEIIWNYCCAADASGLKINLISKIDIPQQPYVFDAEIKINTIYQYKLLEFLYCAF